MSEDNFTLLVEPMKGEPYKSHIFVGSSERTARSIASDKFYLLAAMGKPAVTIKLIRNDEVFASYNGEWSNGNA